MTLPLPIAMLLEMAAHNNGFDRELPPVDDWLGFGSTKAPIKVWLTVRQEVDLELAPSAQPVPLSGEDPSQWPGILLAAVQVERVGQNGVGEVDPPTPWERTDLERIVADPVCHERLGPELRSRFHRHCERVCPNGIHASCADPGAADAPEVCFWQTTFGLPLELIESGQIVPSGQIAIGNFNYRHNLAGVNLVGTEVTSCEEVPGASCYGNGFAEYTLAHSGQVKIRNWEGGTLEASMDNAYIEHGKALAAERTITNPPTSADMALLDSYMKGELKGRPITGNYVLRIWDTPSLQWDHVEDIQLVWKYHYWTRFEHSTR